MPKNPHAVALGRKGGQATSKKKAAAARRNAKRPRPGRRKTAHSRTQSEPDTIS